MPLLDYEQELTSGGSAGEAFTAAAYGSKCYDQKAAQDPGVGEPLRVMFRCLGADVATSTSIDLSLKGSTDGATDSEVEFFSANILAAKLTVASGIQTAGIVAPGKAAERRYLRGKVTPNGGSISGGGKIQIWLMRGNYEQRANQAGTI